MTDRATVEDPHGGPGAVAGDHRDRVLISVEELRRRLAGPDAPQLLDIRWNLGSPDGAGRLRYAEGHLPGAGYLDLDEVLTGPSTDPLLGRHPLPDADRVAAGLAAVGVDARRPIVVYDEPGSFAAGRAWWVLTWLGVDVRVLDGGIHAWVAAGGRLQSGEPTPPPKPLRPARLTAGHLATLTVDEVAAFEGILIDVRAPERYRGELEPIDSRAGHIPGAVNRPVKDFWDAEGKLPPPERLRELLDLPAGEQVAVYCGSGVSAARVLLALTSLGVEAALYPPSWSGWSSDPDRPVAVGG